MQTFEVCYEMTCHFPSTKLEDFKDWFVSSLFTYRKCFPITDIDLNPSPAEPGYVLPLQTVKIQISWLLKKPADLRVHISKVW